MKATGLHLLTGDSQAKLTREYWEQGPQQLPDLQLRGEYTRRQSNVVDQVGYIMLVIQ